MANGNGKGGRLKLAERSKELGDKLGNSQVMTSIFRPGSIFRRGYTDSPRNRSYVIMNSVLYHLHPVKVKRHAVKVSYTLCLGGLSFFLFIILTVTGIFLMHIIINIGMTIGLMPVIGIPLPFVSYGGTALLANSTMIAVALNLHARRDEFAVYGG